MDEKIDNKTRNDLINALERANNHFQELQDKREQRLWKKIDIPCSLFDTINSLTKHEMDKIRKNLELKNLSSLKKAELASELVRLIPFKFKEVIQKLDKGRYGLIKRIIKNSGFIPEMGISTSEVESLMEYSITFPGLYNNQKVLYIPLELANLFLEMDGPELKKIIYRNTEWIGLTHGLLYYYGVASAWNIQKKVEQHTREKVDILEFMDVISLAMDYYGQIKNSTHGFRNHRVFKAKEIAEEHKIKKDIDYYPFSKEQLLKAGEVDYVDKTPAMNSFIQFLSRYYKLTNEETDEIAMELINIINMDEKPAEILQYLESCLEFPSFDFVQELTEKIMELYNNTRMWALKGHTPNELFRREKTHLNVLASKPFKPNQTNSKVIDFKTRNKIGRNEPCPCGSGKKYKKCCWK